MYRAERMSRNTHSLFFLSWTEHKPNEDVEHTNSDIVRREWEFGPEMVSKLGGLGKVESAAVAGSKLEPSTPIDGGTRSDGIHCDDPPKYTRLPLARTRLPAPPTSMHALAHQRTYRLRTLEELPNPVIGQPIWGEAVESGSPRTADLSQKRTR